MSRRNRGSLSDKGVEIPYTLEDKIAVYGALLVLDSEVRLGKHVPWYTICGAVNDKHVNPTYLSEVMTKWPKYSGFQSYPVKVGNEHPKITYERITGVGVEGRDITKVDLWSGEYGILRRELLAFMLEYIRKDILKG